MDEKSKTAAYTFSSADGYWRLSQQIVCRQNEWLRYSNSVISMYTWTINSVVDGMHAHAVNEMADIASMSARKRKNALFIFLL